MKLVKFSGLKEQGVFNNRMTLARAMQRKDDPFPAPLQLGANTVAWRVDDVEAWLERRAAERASTQVGADRTGPARAAAARARAAKAATHALQKAGRTVPTKTAFMQFVKTGSRSEFGAARE